MFIVIGGDKHRDGLHARREDNFPGQSDVVGAMEGAAA